MKLLLLRLLFLSSAGLLLISCRDEKHEFFISLDDSTRQVIFSYVRENKIDVKSKVITTQWSANVFKTDILISNSMGMSKEDIPSYYSVLADSIVVFVYSGIENKFQRDTNEIFDEIAAVLEKHEVELDSGSNYFYYAPGWIYTLCHGRNILVKKISPYERLCIPCGYSLMQDERKIDSLFIMKNGRY